VGGVQVLNEQFIKQALNPGTGTLKLITTIIVTSVRKLGACHCQPLLHKSNICWSGLECVGRGS